MGGAFGALGSVASVFAAPRFRARFERRSARHATSRFLGVAWDRRRQKWVAYIKKHGRQKNLGLFDVEENAARAHDTAARRLHGPYAHLNFPND